MAGATSSQQLSCPPSPVRSQAPPSLHTLQTSLLPCNWPITSTCAGSEASTIDILLGNDFTMTLSSLTAASLLPVSTFWTPTLGGWSTLTSADAQLSTDEPATTDPSLLIVPSTSSSDAPPLDQFWRMETIGISDSPYDSDDAAAQSLFDKSHPHEWPLRGRLAMEETMTCQITTSRQGPPHLSSPPSSP